MVAVLCAGFDDVVLVNGATDVVPWLDIIMDKFASSFIASYRIDFMAMDV